MALTLFLRPSSPWTTLDDGKQIIPFEPLQLPSIGSGQSVRHVSVEAFNATDDRGNRTPTIILMGSDWIQVEDRRVDSMDALVDRLRGWPLLGATSPPDAPRNKLRRNLSRNVLLGVDVDVPPERLQRVLRVVRGLGGADVYLWGAHQPQTDEAQAGPVPWSSCLASLQAPDAPVPSRLRPTGNTQRGWCGTSRARDRERREKQEELHKTIHLQGPTRHHIGRAERIPVVLLEGSWHEDQCLEDLRLEQMAAAADP